MKILFVITGLGVGGAERQVVDLADRFTALGHQVKIVYLTGPALVKPSSSAVSIIGLSMQKRIIDFFYAYLKLRDLIQSFAPDVVHSHMVHSNIFTRLLRLTCHIPKLVCTAHNTNEGGKLRMLMYRLTASLADVTTNVSNEAVVAFEEQGAVRRGTMLALPNGIDTNRFRPSEAVRLQIRASEAISEDEKVFIAVGRLTQAKDYPNLFQAFLKVTELEENVRLWILGDGQLKSYLIEEAERLKIINKVQFLGIQDRVSDWMNAADVFVLSSAWEGFGLVVAEAMGCEKIVVATDSGGVREVLADCGFLVPARDSEALSIALVQALNIENRDAEILSKNARQRVVNNFSLDAVVDRWVTIYGF